MAEHVVVWTEARSDKTGVEHTTLPFPLALAQVPSLAVPWCPSVEDGGGSMQWMQSRIRRLAISI